MNSDDFRDFDYGKPGMTDDDPQKGAHIWEDLEPESKRPLTQWRERRGVKIVALVLLGIYLLYAVFVHPVDKMNLQMMLGRSYSIYLQARALNAGDAECKVDGKIIEVRDAKHYYKYYKLENGILYEYSESKGTWKRSSDDVMLQSTLYQPWFDSDNYERVEGKLFKWKLKDSVYTGEMRAVHFRRTIEGFEFAFMQHGVLFTMTIRRIGITKVFLPEGK